MKFDLTNNVFAFSGRVLSIKIKDDGIALDCTFTLGCKPFRTSNLVPYMEVSVVTTKEDKRKFASIKSLEIGNDVVVLGYPNVLPDGTTIFMAEQIELNEGEDIEFDY